MHVHISVSVLLCVCTCGLSRSSLSLSPVYKWQSLSLFVCLSVHLAVSQFLLSSLITGCQGRSEVIFQHQKDLMTCCRLPLCTSDCVPVTAWAVSELSLLYGLHWLFSMISFSSSSSSGVNHLMLSLWSAYSLCHRFLHLIWMSVEWNYISCQWWKMTKYSIFKYCSWEGTITLLIPILHIYLTDIVTT